MLEFYQAIWRVTGRRQILLLVLSVAVSALAAVPLDYQKRIINGLGGDLTQETLVRLAIEMGAFILLSLALKWLLGFQSGTLGEWVIKRLRTVVCENAIDRTARDGVGPKRGTLANMISSETETIGKFVGSAVSEPVVQFGTLISIVGYIAVTQPRLGLVVMLIVAPQAIIVLLTQTRINALVAERVRVLRQSINTITAEDISAARQSILEDFDRIYDARRRIFLWKLSTKFVLSALNGVGMAAVLLIGGLLVLDGRGDVGTVVAATAGLGRIQQPWRLLIGFYRNLATTTVQYELFRDVLPRAGETEAR